MYIVVGIAKFRKMLAYPYHEYNIQTETEYKYIYTIATFYVLYFLTNQNTIFLSNINLHVNYLLTKIKKFVFDYI